MTIYKSDTRKTLRKLKYDKSNNSLYCGTAK